MTTNGAQQQQLACRLNGHAFACKGCSQLAVIALEWFSNIILSPASQALMGVRQPSQDMAVGKEMFTLCMYCLRREKYIPVFEGKIPRWESVEVLLEGSP